MVVDYTYLDLDVHKLVVVLFVTHSMKISLSAVPRLIIAFFHC